VPPLSNAKKGVNKLDCVAGLLATTLGVARLSIIFCQIANAPGCLKNPALYKYINQIDWAEFIELRLRFIYLFIYFSVLGLICQLFQPGNQGFSFHFWRLAPILKG
jgi:hypothetical protein